MTLYTHIYTVYFTTQVKGSLNTRHRMSDIQHSIEALNNLSLTNSVDGP